MPTKNHILSIFLVMALLTSGSPLFKPAKSGISDRAMLANAVLSVQGLARSGQDEGCFASEIKKALCSLQLAAGLKTVIKTDVDDNAALSLFSSDAPYMVSYFALSPISYCNESIDTSAMNYQSLNNIPIPPPPRVLNSKINRSLCNFKA